MAYQFTMNIFALPLLTIDCFISPHASEQSKTLLSLFTAPQLGWRNREMRVYLVFSSTHAGSKLSPRACDQEESSNALYEGLP